MEWRQRGGWQGNSIGLCLHLCARQSAGSSEGNNHGGKEEAFGKHEVHTKHHCYELPIRKTCFTRQRLFTSYLQQEQEKMERNLQRDA